MEKTIDKGILIEDFEQAVPKRAKLKQVRLNRQHRVELAFGYDEGENLIVVWFQSGHAYARPVSLRRQSPFALGQQKIFNGRIYYRCETLDVVL